MIGATFGCLRTMMPPQSASSEADRAPGSIPPPLSEANRPPSWHPAKPLGYLTAEALLEQLPARCIVHAHHADVTTRTRDLYDGTVLLQHASRDQSTRKSCFSRSLYEERNEVDRLFCQLKAARRIAERRGNTAAIALDRIYLITGGLLFRCVLPWRDAPHGCGETDIPQAPFQEVKPTSPLART